MLKSVRRRPTAPAPASRSRTTTAVTTAKTTATSERPMNRLIATALCASLLAGAAAADGPRPSSTTDTSPVFPGTQTFTAPHRPSAGSSQPNDVTLNFPNADVHEVAKAILGDILGLNYAVDPSATGSVTVQTAEPVAKADVLPILEESL